MEARRQYDLEERTFLFAKTVSRFVESVSKNISNTEYCKQVIRSSGSVGANYIEANESLGKKDFMMRIKICRKEAKETRYWLKLITCTTQEDENRRSLIQESTELTKIFGAILKKSK